MTESKTTARNSDIVDSIVKKIQAVTWEQPKSIVAPSEAERIAEENGHRPNQCDQCDHVPFASPQALGRHKSAVHAAMQIQAVTGEKPKQTVTPKPDVTDASDVTVPSVTCPKCGKPYLRRNTQHKSARGYLGELIRTQYIHAEHVEVVKANGGEFEWPLVSI